MIMKIQEYVKEHGWAMYYRGIGWSPFPIKRADKIPLVRWEKYQTEIASEKQIREWRTQFSEASVGVATGKVSGIVVVDVEAGGSTKDLPATVCAKTGGGGFHFFYKHPSVPVKNAVRIREKTDIRGDGGYVVVPPSLHKSGNRYEWIVSPDDAELGECPRWILEKCSERKAMTNWDEFFSTENLEGTRNQQAATLAGKILYHAPVEMWEVVGLPTLKNWNAEKNKPPLGEKELLATWNSIKKAELDKRVMKDKVFGMSKSNNQNDLLIGIIDQRQKEMALFHNELKDPYVRMAIGQHKEIWSCKSRMFKRRLAMLFWETYQKSPNSNALNAALTVIEGRACFNSPEYILHNRVAWHSDAIWYDLTDSEWRVIKITPEGWRIITDPPILFRRYAHQQPQVEPALDGDVKALLKFLNIHEEDQKILLLVWIVSCFIPDFPHPIPNFYGAQGSAKSLLAKLLRKLIDPSAIEVASFPRDMKEFVQLLAHHFCIFFDNVSHLPDQVSDTLCKAVTGDGFSKRELYTDDDDIIFAFKRCLGINGINLTAKNPDLLERSVLFELERVPPKRRRQERELLHEFENERPRILGGILDTVVKAMLVKPTIQLDSLPRMADFVVWGCAIAEALGYTQKQFLNAYSRNIRNQNAEVLCENLEASAVIKLMETDEEWEGTPSELLARLTEIETNQGVNVMNETDFPKKANVLTRRLNKLKSNLSDEGIGFKSYMKNKRRMIHLHRTPEYIVSTDESSRETGDGNDDDFRNL